MTKDTYAEVNVFFVPPPARWKVIAEAAHKEEIGTVIDDAMRAIEKENKRLKDILGRTYEYCLAKTPKDAIGTYVVATEKTLTETGLAKCNSRLYPANTVFVTARGTVGKLAVAGCPMAMNQSCYALVGKEGYGQYYVYHLTQYVVESLKRKANGAVFDAIVTRDFESEVVPAPAIEDVCSFEKKVASLYEAILNNSNENVCRATLRDTLLPRLISSQSCSFTYKESI